MCERLGMVGVAGILLLQGMAWASDPVALITEVRMGKGEVRVKRAGEADWKVPLPLHSLRPGDQIRATSDGRAVLVFTGGRGMQIVSQANSPFSITAPTTQTGTERVRTLLASVTQILLGQQRELTYQTLSVRSLRQPPRILTPRETKLLPGPVAFEWAGPDHLRYSVRVLSPQGILWQQSDLPRQPLPYPTSGPVLREGVRYTWELETKGHPVQRAQFELLAVADANRIQSALALLDPATLSGYPKNTVTLMRAGLLFQEGIYHGARRELLTAIAADPDEPTLHHLLGQVYDRIGLKELAAQEFDEAQFLSTRSP